MLVKQYLLKSGISKVKGAGGLHQDFLEIDFLVVSDREERYVSETFYQIKKHCS